MMRGSPLTASWLAPRGEPRGEQIGTLGSRGELTPCPPLQGGSGETLQHVQLAAHAVPVMDPVIWSRVELD